MNAARTAGTRISAINPVSNIFVNRLNGCESFLTILWGKLRLNLMVAKVSNTDSEKAVSRIVLSIPGLGHQLPCVASNARNTLAIVATNNTIENIAIDIVLMPGAVVKIDVDDRAQLFVHRIIGRAN